MKHKNVLREWIESIIIAAVLAIFLRTFFFQIYKIPTTSMVPALMPGDKIFVSKLTYGPKVPFTELRLPGFRKPKRGDVAVFIARHDRNKPYVKRLIGVGGDEVMIKGGNVYVNNEVVVDPRIARNYYYDKGPVLSDSGQVDVPYGQYFFLGDNSISSSDGRVWGFVKEKDIVGKSVFIWWPPKRLTMIE